ncbi:MAG: hypothetical protein ACI38B_04375, partial [Bifidobacterium sp.]|uniref:hypothetical protein n=1 Tax=Bifidobacterium sp. TaxID=41200 RepID=UPI003F059DAA
PFSSSLSFLSSPVVPSTGGFFIDAGDRTGTGLQAMKSRNIAGVYRGFADLTVFSQHRLRRRFSRIADFQRSCWEIIQIDDVSPPSPTPDVGDYARIRQIRQFSRTTPPPDSSSLACTSLAAHAAHSHLPTLTSEKLALKGKSCETLREKSEKLARNRQLREK